MEGLGNSFEGPIMPKLPQKESIEAVSFSTFTFFDRTNDHDIKKIPFSCSASDFENAYTIYVVWCLDSGEKPIARSLLSINEEIPIAKE
jgi:hypothetical protein